VANIDSTMLSLLASGVTVLQHQTASIADVRVVVIGNETFSWRRPRGACDPVDWRESDPTGRLFVSVDGSEIHAAALAINSGLGLSVSMQDWVVDRDGDPTFLEANPCGAWLFLTGAREKVGPALAKHLIGLARSGAGP